jgi:hypothetical protein
LQNSPAISCSGRRSHTRCVWPRWKKFDKNIIGGNTVLNQDFKEFLQSLNANGVRYLVVGGYAVAFHGHPRYTKDIDIWVDVSQANAERIVRALDQFGFASLGLKAEDFLVPDQIIQLGYPPSRIDLISAIPGVEFDHCYAARVETLIDGVAVHFIDLADLKKNKQASGRLQDLADLESLA